MAESKLDTKTYRCHLAISRDDEGRFSAVVLNLPGAGSCGDTKEEAIANAREAVLGVIESYRDEQLEIPWTVHRGQYIGKGLLKAQIDAAGLTVAEFIALL